MGRGEDTFATRPSVDLQASVTRQARLAAQARLHQRQRRRRLQRSGGFMALIMLLLAGIGYAYSRREPSQVVFSAPVSTPAVAASISPSATDTAASMPATSLPAISPDSKAVTMYGVPASGLPWHSGMWVGGQVTSARLAQAGAWRGRSLDFATVYPAYGSWSQISSSTWTVSRLRGYPGRLSYGLPLLPTDRTGKWQDVLNGSHDEVFRNIARLLVANGHGDSAIRMGVEVNGYWFPWAVTVKTTEEYKQAYVRVRRIMKAEAPHLTFWLDLNYGSQLRGGASPRMAPLTALYPGDGLVDGISMDHYDRGGLVTRDLASWQAAISPTYGPGLADAVLFARQHKLGFAVPEWGLDGVSGPGDNPYFMQKMYDFFVDNRDVLVYENYFNESGPTMRNSLFDPDQNPKSSQAYHQLWGLHTKS